jgi:hypothetical protein
MGLVWHIMVLKCLEKSVYVLQTAAIFRLPSSLADIQNGGLQTLINNIYQIKVRDIYRIHITIILTKVLCY